MDSKNNKNSPQPKGSPSGSSRDSSGIKDFDSDKLESHKEIENNYLDENGEPSANVREQNPNRNTDKGQEN